MGFFHFGEINKSLFWVFSIFFFSIFFLVGYYISKDIENIRDKKIYFLKKFKIMICLFHRNGKTLLILLLKNHLLYPNLTIRCKKVEKIAWPDCKMRALDIPISGTKRNLNCYGTKMVPPIFEAQNTSTIYGGVVHGVTGGDT